MQTTRVESLRNEERTAKESSTPEVSSDDGEEKAPIVGPNSSVSLLDQHSKLKQEAFGIYYIKNKLCKWDK